MEYVTACNICYNEYKENVRIPKMLSCGHSICLSCVRNLIRTKLNCPTCRKELDPNKAAEEYPTNYYVFGAKNIAKKESNILFAVKNRIKALKDRFISRKSEISADLHNIQVYLKQLQSLTNEENEVIELKTTIQVLDKLEYEFKNIKLSGFSRLRDSANMRLNSYKNSHEFLTEIYRKLQKNETIYTVKNLDDEVKYGKVSCQGDMILFHALSETDNPGKVSLIWFDDLKSCLTQDSFFTFLKLSCDETEMIRLLTIKMFDSQMAMKFITLCTGECGIGYKGRNYKRYVLNGNHYRGIFKTKPIDMRLVYRKNMPIDYNTKNKNDVKMSKGDLFVCCGKNFFGLFRLFEDMLIADAVGKVESPLNIEDCISFKDESKLLISDSGIALKI